MSVCGQVRDVRLRLVSTFKSVCFVAAAKDFVLLLPMSLYLLIVFILIHGFINALSMHVVLFFLSNSLKRYSVYCDINQRKQQVMFICTRVKL